jgi:GTP-binding protein
MLPVIAIVGRPNVGKSTLFNRLTRSRAALVADQPGVTRDRHYGYAEQGRRRFIVVDTGGIGGAGPAPAALTGLIEEQALQAARQADAVLWLVDARSGRTAVDEQLASILRPICPRLYLVVNKGESLDPDAAAAEFHGLGAGEPVVISAEHDLGISQLLDGVLAALPDAADSRAPGTPGLRIAVLGRPNAGKSTLVNRMLGEDRMVVSDVPGTTRDSVSVPFERRGRHYVLIDTAGVRRRARIDSHVEKISVVKSLQSMDMAQIVIVVIDAREGVTDQDTALLGLCAQSGKGLIIALNKWDGMPDADRTRVQSQVDRKLGFVEYACNLTVSALHGTGVGRLFDLVDTVGRSLQISIQSATLTGLLQKAVEAHQPPLVRGRRIKLRYAHLGGHDPLRVIIHGNQTEHVPDSYRRYLCGFLRKSLGLAGTPVLVEFKRGDNPFRGRKNVLTRRQTEKRRRLVRHRKSR